MFNTTILEHFERPRNAGELPPPAWKVEAANPICGDILHLWVLIDSGCIRQIRFKAKGCVAAIACGSLLTELVSGKKLDEVQGLSSEQIANHLGGVPPESGHAAELAAEALKKVIQMAAARSG